MVGSVSANGVANGLHLQRPGGSSSENERECRSKQL
jgi:hypothetical protein